MNSGKNKVNPLPENKTNGIKNNNNKLNGTKDNKALNKNGTSNFNGKMNDPKDFYQIISQSINGMNESAKKNGKKKIKVNKDEDLKDFKLLGRKTSKP